MNAMLQRHNAKFIYAVPDGLRELMSDISREVLRSQPTQIYTFIADYMDALLITRENARIAARLVENIAEIAYTIANFLERTGVNREEVDKMVKIIQVAFRKYLSVRPQARPNEQVEEEEFLIDVINNIGIMPEKAEEAAIVIQNAYRQFKEKQEKQRELLKGMIDWRIAARSAIYLYKKTGVTTEEAHRAATLIKAAYKGYYTRRTMRRIAEQSRVDEAIPEEMGEEEDLWYEDLADEYLPGEEGFDGEFGGGEEVEDDKFIVEGEKFVVGEEKLGGGGERSGTAVAEKLLDNILDNVIQISENVAAPPPSPSQASVTESATDVEGGDTTGGEATDISEA